MYGWCIFPKGIKEVNLKDETNWKLSEEGIVVALFARLIVESLRWESPKEVPGRRVNYLHNGLRGSSRVLVKDSGKECSQAEEKIFLDLSQWKSLRRKLKTPSKNLLRLTRN